MLMGGVSLSVQVRHVRGGMAERRGKGLQIPLHGFKSRSDLQVEVQVRNDQSRSGEADGGR